MNWGNYFDKVFNRNKGLPVSNPVLPPEVDGMLGLNGSGKNDPITPAIPPAPANKTVYPTPDGNDIARPAVYPTWNGLENKSLANTVATLPIATPDVTGPKKIATPRAADPDVKKEFQLRLSDPFTSSVYANPTDQARYDYVTHNGTVDPNKRSWGEFFKNAGTGALQGLATGGFPGAVLGAAGGGLAGAIDPARGRTNRFNTFALPELEHRRMQRWQEEHQRMENERAQSEIDKNNRVVLPDGTVMDNGRVTRAGTPKVMKPDRHNLPENVPGYLEGDEYKNNPGYKPKTQTSKRTPYNENVPAYEVDGKMVPNPYYVPPDKRRPPKPEGLTPAQELQNQRQERSDAMKLAREAEDLKAEAIRLLNTGRTEDAALAQTVLGQHTAAAEELATNFPDYYDVKVDNKWVTLKAKPGGGRRQIPKGRSNSGGSSLNLYDESNYKW